MIAIEELSRFRKFIEIAKKVRIILWVVFIVSIPVYLINSAPIYFNKIEYLTHEEQAVLTGNFLLLQTICSILFAAALLFVPVPIFMNRMLDRKYLERIKTEYFPTPEATIGLREMMKLLSVQEPDLHRLGLDKPGRIYSYADFVKGFTAVKKLDIKYDKTRKFRIGVKF